MAIQTYIDWTVTLEINGVTLIETDVRVAVSVYDDATLKIRDVRLIYWEAETNQYLDKPFDYKDSFGAAIYDAMEDYLIADESFCEKACDVAGVRYVGQGSNDPEGHFVLVEAE